MLKPAWLVMTFLKIVNMTVAMMAAAAVRRAVMKVKMDREKEYHREYRERMHSGMERKFRIVPVRKKPNMRCEARRMSERMVFISAGRVMVAPAKSSLRRISTGLNQ